MGIKITGTTLHPPPFTSSLHCWTIVGWENWDNTFDADWSIANFDFNRARPDLLDNSFKNNHCQHHQTNHTTKPPSNTTFSNFTYKYFSFRIKKIFPVLFDGPEKPSWCPWTVVLEILSTDRPCFVMSSSFFHSFNISLVTGALGHPPKEMTVSADSAKLIQKLRSICSVTV